MLLARIASVATRYNGRFTDHEVCALTAPGALNSAAGSLYVVATPIGNLDDISARALKILREVALIAAEDTRHSQRLMQHFGIPTPLAACHEHNERDEGSRFITRLLAGDDVALISDAGTPLISDPGYHLVRQARAAGINVVPVPGACALIAALSAAGLPSDRFIFEGFLPAKAVGRRARLEPVEAHTTFRRRQADQASLSSRRKAGLLRRHARRARLSAGPQGLGESLPAAHPGQYAR